MKQLSKWILALSLITPNVWAHPHWVSPTPQISGPLSAVGSDTLAPLMSQWAIGFQRLYPDTFIQVQGAGSSSVPTALIQSVAQLGSMTRPMNQTELQRFKKQFGYEPLQIPVAIDALSVFVHKSNPIESISLLELDALFSNTLRCGGERDLQDWGGLKVKNGDPIKLYGRTSVSGTYGYFKENVLCRGDFHPKVHELLGAASVIHAVANSVNGIGYGRLESNNNSVKFLPIRDTNGVLIHPTEANLRARHYPLTREVYLYVNRAPNKALSPLLDAFLKFVLSDEGQALAKQAGYVPLSEKRLVHLRTLLQ